jgi:DNA-binding NarL/FixJ family response regulator
MRLDSSSKSDALTRREREVATLVCQGLANKEIARQLELSEGTVKIHTHAIYQKLGVRNRAGLLVSFSSLWD